jgi:hypothetical protein
VAVLVAARDLSPLEDVIGRLQSAFGELADGTDDPQSVVSALLGAGVDLDEFTGGLRRVLGG